MGLVSVTYKNNCFIINNNGFTVALLLEDFILL